MKRFIVMAAFSAVVLAPPVARAEDKPAADCRWAAYGSVQGFNTFSWGTGISYWYPTTALNVPQPAGQRNCTGPIVGNTDNASPSVLQDLQAEWGVFGTWSQSGGDFGTGGGLLHLPTGIAAGSAFVLALKQGDHFSLYLLDATQALTTSSNIYFSTAGVKDGETNGLSHADLYVVTGGTGNILSVTPEPATITMMATGLVGVAGLARRRRKKG